MHNVTASNPTEHESDEKSLVEAVSEAVKRLRDRQQSDKIIGHRRRKLPGGGEYLAEEEIGLKR